MSRDRTAIAWRRRAVALSLIAVMFGFGCSPSTLFFLFQGDRLKAPAVPLPAKEGKEEVTVAVFTNGSPTMGIEFAGSERELALLIGQVIAKETEKQDVKIRVIEQAKVDRLKNTPGRDWRTANPALLGKELGADYVLDVTVNSMSMKQPEFGGEFYQGRANLQVVVYDTDAPNVPMMDYPHSTIGEQKGVSSGNPAPYRKTFLQQVATEVAHQHIPYEAARFQPRR